MLKINEKYTVQPISVDLGDGIILKQDEVIKVIDIKGSLITFEQENGQTNTVPKMALEFVVE